MNDLQELMDEICKWSDETFDSGNFNEERSLSTSHHLQKESKELIEALKIYQEKNNIKSRTDVHEEIADVFMLLLDTAKHFNINAKELILLAKNKLDVNKKREWGEPDENGVVEHIRNDNLRNDIDKT